jgi:DNA-binding transcriptional MerR regulator
MCRYGELVREGSTTVTERREMLEAHRAGVRERIAELRRDLEMIDLKIETYQVMEHDSVAIGQE